GESVGREGPRTLPPMLSDGSDPLYHDGWYFIPPMEMRAMPSGVGPALSGLWRTGELLAEVPYKLIDLTLGLQFRLAVALLDLANKLLALTLHLLQLVVGKLAPLLPCLALGLLPHTLQSILNHMSPLFFCLLTDGTNQPLKLDQRCTNKRGE